jgi:hypothetical protein
MGRPSYDDETLAAVFQPLHEVTWNDRILGPVLRDLAERDPDLIAAVADVDRSLIRECLTRTPEELFRRAAAYADDILRIRRQNGI